jgi:hypothetical protein
MATTSQDEIVLASRLTPRRDHLIGARIVLGPAQPCSAWPAR